MVIDPIFPQGFELQLKALATDDPKKNEAKHECYNGAVAHAEEMSWHVYGKKPLKLLKRARPREDPAITLYRLESYEPITKAACKKALQIVHKIFNPTLYSIRFGQDSNAEELQNYSLVNYPRFNSIVSYLANYAMKKMIADPNAIFIIQPYQYDIPANERVQPIVTCYHSKDIWLINDQYCLLFDDYTDKDPTRQNAKIWDFTYADKNGIYKIELVNIGQNWTVNTLQSYVHGFGELPFWYLTGEYTENADDDYGTDQDDGHKDDEEDSALFESFFYGAVPFWNEAINDHSDVVGGYRNHMWPHKWEVADECEYVELYEGKSWPCQNGWIFNGDEKHKCPSCKGSGYSTAKSPLETTIINRDKFNEAGPAGGQIPFGYVTVPTEALKMLEDKANNNIEKGLEALNMDVVNEIGLNQSGKAKEMDRTELNDFLQRIADTMFDLHLQNIYYFFVKYMFSIQVKDAKALTAIMPQIAKPTQFDIYSSSELTDQFAKAKTAKVNPSYLRIKQAEIQNKEFSTNPDLLSRLNLELTLDSLAEVSSDEVSLKLANGTITQETAVIHDNISSFVSRAIEEDKGFADKKTQDQLAVLDKYAKEVIKQTRIKIDTAALETLNQDPNRTTVAFDRQPLVKM